MPREPAGVLGKIIARKRQDVAARLAGVSLEEQRGRAGPTKRSLKSVLAQPGARFVMEVKRSSPSQGKLCDAVDPARVARAYRAVADAISVLTDGPYFGGSFADLEAVRAEVDCPVLCKDFIVDPRQVPEARAHGADAILVMLSVLDDAEAAAMIAEARRFGMDALVEAHTAEEVDRAVALGAEIIGINNRDLISLEVDLGVTEQLAARVPMDRVLVSESGIDGRADVKRLSSCVDAFLVGSSLMRRPDVAVAARELVTGRVKVCGLTRPEDARAAKAAGALYGGLIFAADSPRRVDRAGAERVTGAFGDEPLPMVGVFRDEPVSDIARDAERHSLVAVQVHGAADTEAMAALREELPHGCEIWAVAGVDGEVGEPPSGADRIVYDAVRSGRSGGTGQAFDWSLLHGHDLGRAILAGGLNPPNARAADAVGAWALDVNSGVEDAPGVKSPEKLRAFFEALRPLSRQELRT